MNAIELDPVQTAWQANLKVNQVLLEHLTPDMLGARTPGGGFSVAQHLAPIVGTTKYWGVQLDEGLKTLPGLFTIREDLDEEDIAAFVPETDLTRIREVLVQTATAAREAVNRAEGTGPYRTPAPTPT